MAKFRISLAGVPIEILSLYQSSCDFCKGYYTDEDPMVSIEITGADIEFEQSKSARERELEGHKPSVYSPEYLETLAIYRKIAVALINYDIILCHGSVIAVDGQAYMFTAKSGTGKSTHTRLWREYFGERAVMVNDDKPLIRFADGGVYAYGTPWDGKHHLSTNISMPLKAICILGRDSTNHIEPVSFSDGYSMLIQQTYRPSNTVDMMKTLSLVDRFKGNVSLYRLGCNMEPDAVRVAYEGMR